MMEPKIRSDGSSSVTSPPLQFFAWSLSPGFGSPFRQLREPNSEERGLYLIHLLIACANHVAAGSMENTNIGLQHICQLASPDGDSMQRIAAYFTEALAVRVVKGWPGLHDALNSTKISTLSEKLLAQRMFFELCPFLKLAYLVTNQAIIEAMDGEKMVHIIDFNPVEPAQWINLLRTFGARRDGPPHLRITGIHEQKEVLDQMALRLAEEAEKLDMSFQFNSIVGKLENIDLESLRKTGEALAISSVLQLHSLLATGDEIQRSSSTLNFNPLHRVQQVKRSHRTLGEWLEKDLVHVYSPSPDSTLSLVPSPKMDKFLNGLWNLSPKLMVITEQESDHNDFSLMERVKKSLNFYAELFDCLESAASRASVERQKVEKMLFGEEIKNIIACEGIERKERHETLEKWILRLELAGFGRVPLSYDGMLQASSLLQTYGYDQYKIKEENGCLGLCRHDRPLFSMSAWRFRRFD